MNDYTRREEARWTFIAATVLIVCIAAAVALVFTARGKLVPDPGARAQAKASDQKAAAAAACVTQAERLAKEVPIFQTQAKAAHLVPEPEPEPKKPVLFKKPKKEKEPDVAIAWSAAMVLQRQAKLVSPCQEVVDGALGPRADATPAWQAVAAAAAIAAPAENDKTAQLEAARRIHAAFADAPVDKLEAAARDAATALRTAADRDAQAAERAFVEEALPPGLLSREIAISVAVGIAIVALLVSFLSVRAASMRRMVVLLPLRELARTPQRGLQAAAILRLAAAPNGGEPGLVIGAAVGGLLAAALFRLDADIFVAGVMGGLLIGLAVQYTVRAAVGLSRWRARATEIAEIEKPAIPVVLVLSGVNGGLEAQFVDFFDKLTPADAAATVERLAAQAEERILAQADAQVAQPMAPPTPSPGSYGPPR